MLDDTISERDRQTAITRLATLNSAATFFTLTHGEAPITIDDWMTLAELLEQWVWRGLTPESVTPLPPSPVPPPVAPSSPPPAVASSVDHDPTVSRSTLPPPTAPPVHPDPAASRPALPPTAERPNGNGPRPSPPPVRPPAAPASSPPAPPPAGARQGPLPDKATVNQIKAIFGIGKAKGYSTSDLKAWVNGQFHKRIDDLAFREASKLIEYLKAL